MREIVSIVALHWEVRRQDGSVEKRTRHGPECRSATPRQTVTRIEAHQEMAGGVRWSSDAHVQSRAHPLKHDENSNVWHEQIFNLKLHFESLSVVAAVRARRVASFLLHDQRESPPRTWTT
ncbi:uncharacterized protein VTP21DRAFT_5662 [Calcarisporiella thermophila]|uniref:uncharacterized protein n=1 Tax=Calcarisporiella thermophila TaxID=911321 RepID=UPI00374222C8